MSLDNAQRWTEFFAKRKPAGHGAFWLPEEIGEALEFWPMICGVSCACGFYGELLACALPISHDGPHSWASLPTFTAALPARRGEEMIALEEA